MKYSINVAEFGQILSARQPTEKFNALVSFLDEYLDVSTRISGELSAAKKIDFNASIWLENEEYIYNDFEDTIVFTGGDILKTISNQGHERLFSINNLHVSSGANKIMHPINWILSLKENQYIVKDIPHKYIVHLFKNVIEKGWLPKISSENKAVTLADPSTKGLFHIEDQLKFGFIMRNYGPSLDRIASDKAISYEKKVKIAALYVEQALSLLSAHKTHGDLKLENACYHDAYYAKGEDKTQEKVTLIDLDGMCPINDVLQRPPIFTVEYLNSIFNLNRNLLCLGEYRIIHDLWAMVETCDRLIFNTVEPNLFFQKRLDDIHELLIAVHNKPKNLSREAILKDVHEIALEFSVELMNDLGFKKSTENLSSIEKAEENKADILVQNNEVKSEHHESKKRKVYSGSFFELEKTVAQKKPRIEQKPDLQRYHHVSYPG